MKSMGSTLLIMIGLTFLSVVLGSSFIGGSTQFSYDSSIIINGTTSTLAGEYNMIFGLNDIQGLLAIIITITTLVSIIGIQVVGSGLSDSTVRTLTIIAFYGGIWTVFSILSYNLLASIPSLGGVLLWIIFTIGYTVGVAQKISGGNSE